MSTETKTQKTLADYNQILSDLRARLEQNQREAGAIPSRRGELALAAAEGDTTAFDKMRDLEAEEQKLAIEAKNIHAAIERAEELRVPLVREAKRQALKARRATTETIINRYIDASAAVDVALENLRDVLEARQEIGAELYRYQWATNPQTARDWSSSVHSQTVMNAPNYLIHAASSAGLQPFFPGTFPLLADSDHVTLEERARQHLQLPPEHLSGEDL